MPDLKPIEEEIKEEAKITCLDDYDWNDLGLSDEYIEKIKLIEDKFKWDDLKAEGDLEWRPTFKFNDHYGACVYQG